MSAEPTSGPPQPTEPERTISVGQLRQNPTRMLRDVRAGSVWTITDHGEPIAEVRPLRPSPWVPSEVVVARRRDYRTDEQFVAQWLADLAEDRRHAQFRDPWGASS